MHYVLFYEKIPDFAARQQTLMIAHRSYVMAAAERGDLLLAGSLGNPDDGAAILLFRAESPELAESFAKADPYVTGGIISRWSVRPWDIVAGAGLASLTN